MDLPILVALVSSKIFWSLFKPAVIKEPVTPCTIWTICYKCSPVITICALVLCVLQVTLLLLLFFFPFNEPSLRCCDVKLSKGSYVVLFIARCKTDILRAGNTILLAKIDNITCPFYLLTKYVQSIYKGLSLNLAFVLLFTISKV